MAIKSEQEKAQARKLLSRPATFDYFFRNLDDPDWFDFALELNVFKEIPKPEISEDGQTIQFPVWSPGIYLTKVADRIPEQVSEVLKSLNTDNTQALRLAMEALIKLPTRYSKDLLGVIDGWLDKKFSDSFKYLVIELFDKYLSDKDYGAFLLLLDIALKPRKGEKDVEKAFRLNNYHLDLLSKKIDVLVEAEPQKVIKIIEARFREIESLEDKDTSSFWRSAIENNSQNWKQDDLKDFLVDVLRDSLNKLHELDSSEARAIVEKFIAEEKYSIFNRLGISAVRLCNIDDLVPKILLDTKNLTKTAIHHEFVLLLRDKFSVLNKSGKSKLIDEIIGFKNEDDIYKRHHIARRLVMIKDQLENDPDVTEFKYLLKEYSKEIADSTDHPEFLSYSTSWTGPTSPLNKDDVAKMTPDEFIAYVKQFEPPADHFAPTPEGLARIFTEVVQDNPGVYAEIAERFLEEGIYPAYISSLYRGLANATKAGADFNWGEVINLSNGLLELREDLAEKSKRDEFDYGNLSWVRGSIADLLEDGLRKDDHGVPKELMSAVKELTLKLAVDADPTPEDEKVYGGDNMDFITYSINTNRGKAFHALILYALRYARFNKSNQKSGSRLEPDVKTFLNERLQKDPSPTIQSVFTQYLPNLEYLDKDWVHSKIADSSLFPKDPSKKEIWKGHVEGYVSYHAPSKAIYDLLKDDYKLAIDEYCTKTTEKSRNHANQRLAEHVMLGFWYGYEEFDKGSLSKYFFDNANEENREHAIRFLGRALESNKPIDPEKWKRLRDFWSQRVAVAKDKELVGFIDWLDSVPETVAEISDLLKSTIPLLYRGYEEDKLYDYLLKNVKTDPKTVLEMLIILLKTKESSANLFYGRERLKEILSIARMDKESARQVNVCVEMLIKSGNYDFKDLAVPVK